MSGPEPPFDERPGAFTEGWVAVADIIGFSLKSEVVQQDLAASLMAAVESTTLYRRHLRGGAAHALICTGDGFILVVADAAIGGRGEQLLLFAEEIQAAATTGQRRLEIEYQDSTSSKDREFGVRLGLHRGSFAFELIHGQRNAIGTGINVANRVAQYGDGGHILMSSAFAHRVQQRATLGNGQYLSFLAEAGVKHNFKIAIYAYHREQDGVVVYGRTTNTKVGERQLRIDKLLLDELQRLCHQLSDSVQKKNLDPDEVKFRLTVLAPTASREQGESPKYLAVTGLRYIFGDEPATSTDAAYRIDADRPEGVSAHAYVKREPKVITGLPDRYRDYPGYVRALADVGLTEETISQFRRPCRAFIAVPFQLPVTEDTWFVLTLDSLHPLFDKDSQEIGELIKRMQESTKQIGILIELKQPLPSGRETRRKE